MEPRAPSRLSRRGFGIIFLHEEAYPRKSRPARVRAARRARRQRASALLRDGPLLQHGRHGRGRRLRADVRIYGHRLRRHLRRPGRAAPHEAPLGGRGRRGASRDAGRDGGRRAGAVAAVHARAARVRLGRALVLRGEGRRRPHAERGRPRPLREAAHPHGRRPQDRRRGRGLLRLGSSAEKAARRARVRRRRVLRLPRAAPELPGETPTTSTWSSSPTTTRPSPAAARAREARTSSTRRSAGRWASCCSRP